MPFHHSKKHLWRLSFICALCLIVLTYNQCGVPLSDSRSELILYDTASTLAAMGSVEAFESTVYQITANRCQNCHQVQSPIHASRDVRLAHDSLINGQKVNFSNIPKSRIVEKIHTENHGCWGNCQDNASEMVEAVTQWYQLIQDNEQQNGENRPIEEYDIVTHPSMQLESYFSEESSIFQIPVTQAVVNAPFEVEGNPPTLYAPPGAGNFYNSGEPNAGTARFVFDVISSGTYRLYGDVLGVSGQDNSFFIRVDEENYFDWHLVEGTAYSIQEVTRGSQRNTMEFELTSGIHTFTIKQREDNTKIRSLILSPASLPVSSSNDIAVVRFPLEHILGEKDVFFQIYIEEFDEYSYLISAPQLIGHRGNIRIKNIKLLLNGDYNPQHSTYTLVDTVLAETQTVVSPYAMVVLKDKGVNQDVLSFAFEVFQPVSGINPPSLIGNPASVQGFSGSVYNLTRQYCIDCHQTEAPRHASADVNIAHDDVVGQYMVNFISPAGSRLVERLSVDEHHCWSDCTQNAAQMQEAINNWSQSF